MYPKQPSYKLVIQSGIIRLPVNLEQLKNAKYPIEVNPLLNEIDDMLVYAKQYSLKLVIKSGIIRLPIKLEQR